MTAQLEENVGALAVSYSHAVHNQIQCYKKELELAASMNEITQEDTVERDALLAQIADKTGFVYLALADSTGQTTRNSNISEREYFKMAMAGETYISSPLVNQVDGTVTIMMEAPVDNNTGYKGVLYGGLLYDTFSEIINNIKIGDGGYAFVVDKTGVMVAHPDGSVVEAMTNYIETAKQDSTYQSVADAVSRMILGESGTAYTKYSGLDRLYGFTPIEGPENWSIAVTVPVNQIMTKVYQVMLLCLIVLLILLAVSIFMALRVSRSITKPIAAATQRIELLAEGNLSSSVATVKGRDELARLSAALSNTITQLRSYIGDISAVLTAMSGNDFTVASVIEYKGEFMPLKTALYDISSSLNHTLSAIDTSVGQVNSSAVQISSSAQNLAAGATEQAASVQELSASILQVAEQERKNLESVKLATEYVYQVNSSVQESSKQMIMMTEAMNKIASSADQISHITKLIEEIAFQTNILALNAAIEAARAGSAGKGFAVVAEEVRTLAGKSAEAAKQTAELIQGSLDAVTQGSAIAGTTSEMLAELAQKADQVAESIGEIEASSSEQTTAIMQISEGISQVSAVVEVNAASAEESSAASEELSSLAEELHREVGKFQLIRMDVQ